MGDLSEKDLQFIEELRQDELIQDLLEKEFHKNQWNESKIIAIWERYGFDEDTLNDLKYLHEHGVPKPEPTITDYRDHL